MYSNRRSGGRATPPVAPVCLQTGTPLVSEEELIAAQTWEAREGGPPAPHRDPSPDPLSPAELARVILPAATYPSAERLQTTGIYLLAHAEGLFLSVGLDADEQVGRPLLCPPHIAPAQACPLFRPPTPQSVSALFGPGHFSAAMLPRAPTLERLRTDLSLRVWAVIDALRVQRQAHAPLFVVVPSDVEARDRFASLLVEDRVGGARSYVDLLCHVHSAIQAKMS